MIRRFNDYENIRASSVARALPSGGYVGKVMGTKIGTYSDGRECLIISLDITEGEYIGYYAERYRNDPEETRRWKGNFRLTIPSDDGSERDSKDKRSFKTAMVSIEESNPGYHWDWNELGLKGKTVGFLVRQKEWSFNGSTGWAPEIYKLIAADDARQGNFKKIADKPIVARNVPNAAEEIASGGDLPF